jgi:threonine/homoserine/homoserine lactone efflux protein
MQPHDFIIFAFATLMLNLTPGNDMIYVASRSTGQGVKAGIVSALGVMAGCMVHIIGSVAGLSAIIASSATAFDILKYTGAAYLIYLGIRSWIGSKKSPFQIKEKVELQSYRKIFVQGLITNVLNPKVALFFLAFLPQFMDKYSSHPQWRILFLGIWFDFSGTVVNIAVAILFGRMGNSLATKPGFVRMQERVSGLVLIALGIKVGLSSKIH